MVLRLMQGGGWSEPLPERWFRWFGSWVGRWLGSAVGLLMLQACTPTEPSSRPTVQPEETLPAAAEASASGSDTAAPAAPSVTMLEDADIWRPANWQGLWQTAGVEFVHRMTTGDLLLAMNVRGSQAEIGTWLRRPGAGRDVAQADTVTWDVGAFSVPVFVPSGDLIFVFRPTEGIEQPNGRAAVSMTMIDASGTFGELSRALALPAEWSVAGSVAAAPWPTGALVCWPNRVGSLRDRSAACAVATAVGEWENEAFPLVTPGGDVTALQVATGASGADGAPAVLLLLMVQRNGAGRVYAQRLDASLNPVGSPVDLWGEDTPMTAGSAWRSRPLLRQVDERWAIAVPGRTDMTGVVAALHRDGEREQLMQVAEWSGFRTRAVLAVDADGAALVFDEAGREGERSIVRYSATGPEVREVGSPLGTGTPVRQGGIWQGRAVVGFETDGEVALAVIPEGALIR